ncbi:MAG: orotidine-5'-phosphate decarboxylase [Bacillota bacterium]
MTGKGEIIVALDMKDPGEALSLVRELAPEVTMFKVGMELFYASGSDVIDSIAGLGAKVFCDLKLHDIPATVKRAASVLTRPGVSMIDVHAAGGSQMMVEALAGVYEAAAVQNIQPPRVIAVTLLTSIDHDVLTHELGFGRGLTEYVVTEYVVRMAEVARASGLNGVVTSAFEVGAIHKACGDGFITVVPGVRPTWAGEPHDQKRFVTPREAVFAGADYLVVGRPITRARSPRDAARALLDEVREAREDVRRGKFEHLG